jgi:hypothetical protein
LLLLASEVAKALVLVFIMKRNQKTTAAPALRSIGKSNGWLMTATVVKQNDCCGDLQLATCDLRLATCDLRLATCDLRLATCDLRLAIGLLVLLFVLGYENKQVK